MNIAIIYGSPRKGITYETVQIVKAELQTLGPVEFTEFHLPQDMPAFCKGCFQCFQKGEDKCPDAQYVQPIVEAMMKADGFIISSPVYVLQISGALKVLFDHMAYCYINHRPRFYTHKALVITTTAGAGTENANKYIKQNLTFWGINKVYTFGGKMMALSWKEVSPQVLSTVTKQVQQKTRSFYRDLNSKKIYPPGFIQTVMFQVSRLLMLSYQDNMDNDYWQEKGWLNKRCNYLYPEAKPGILKKMVGRLASFGFSKIFKIKPIQSSNR
jgi:multimeric flavodoxin WrbA